MQARLRRSACIFFCIPSPFAPHCPFLRPRCARLCPPPLFVSVAAVYGRLPCVPLYVPAAAMFGRPSSPFKGDRGGPGRRGTDRGGPVSSIHIFLPPIHHQPLRLPIHPLPQRIIAPALSIVHRGRRSLSSPVSSRSLDVSRAR